MEYLYDLREQFRHKIILESIEEGIPPSDIIVTDGARACPPEDCGSPYKYAQKLQILKSGPSHKDYRDTMREFQNAENYKSQKFDPEYFDLKEINKNIGFFWKPQSTARFPTQVLDDMMFKGPPTVFPPKKCALCGKDSEAVCGKCKLIYYCCKEHQLEHWTKHKAICALLTAKQQ
jgi:hypothetical protein